MMRMAVVNPSLAPSIKASYTLIFFHNPQRIKKQDDGEKYYIGNQCGIDSHVLAAYLGEQVDKSGKEQADATDQNEDRFIQQVYPLCNADGNHTDSGGNGSGNQCRDEDVGGCAAPICERYIMMLTGININPEVFSTRNIIIGLVAVSFFGLSSEVLSWLSAPLG